MLNNVNQLSNLEDNEIVRIVESTSIDELVHALYHADNPTIEKIKQTVEPRIFRKIKKHMKTVNQHTFDEIEYSVFLIKANNLIYNAEGKEN
ncbi:MAG: FliG C-terminal domain-containing protein [Candidatus Muiribacteriota bacterium]